MSEGPPIEVIGHGREPGGPRRPQRALPRGLRATGYVLLAAGCAAGVWLVARPRPVASPRAPVTAAVTGTVEAAPDARAALPAHLDLTVSVATGDHSFIAFGGHVLLFLRVTYTGAAPLRLVDGRVPQGGAFPDAGAGGLTAGTTANVALHGHVPTEIFVRTRVDCPDVLAGAPVDHLDLVAQPEGGQPLGERIDLAGLGNYWDEARHAACTRPDARRDVVVTVDGVRGTRAAGTARPWIEAVVSLHDAAGFDAVVSMRDPGSSAVSFSAEAMTSAGAIVDGGSSYLTPVRWTVDSCPAAKAAPPPTLALQVTVAESHATLDGDLGPAFAQAWRLALLQACG